MNAIAASIHQGEGSLGKLIRDDSLHQRLTELSHRSEQTLTSLDENLAALKETWPISRYFDAGPIWIAIGLSSSRAPHATAVCSRPTTCSSPAARS